MVDISLTLHVEGQVSARVVGEILVEFENLAVSLAQHAQPRNEAKWILSGLEYGSATAAIEPTRPQGLERVPEDFIKVGELVRQGGRSENGLGPALVIAQRMHKRILRESSVTHLQFLTNRADVVIPKSAEPPSSRIEKFGAYGEVIGRVQTLSSRTGFRFTLYDALYDRAVTCYLSEGRQELIREAWDRRAAVSGWVVRDRRSGRPMTIRQVSAIRVLPEPTSGAFEVARGVFEPDEIILPNLTIGEAVLDD